MTLDKLEGLSLIELKLVAKEVGVKGFAMVSTKDKMRDKIIKHCNEFGLEEVPDLSISEEDEPAIISNRPIPMAKKRIKDFHRKKVIIESRDPDINDYPFSLNEYSCYIQMGKEILLPVPVIDMIKELKEPRHIKDSETGFSKTEYTNRFLVSFV